MIFLVCRLRNRPEAQRTLQMRVQRFESGEDLDTDELTAEQEKQSIERREDDFFWCAACGIGPMTSTLTVEKHLATAKHARKYEIWAMGQQGSELQAQIPEQYASQGIIAGGCEGAPDHLKIGEMFCTFCNAGPLTSTAS